MAITIGAIAGCYGCSYGCHCWVLLLGAIAGGPWPVLAMGRGAMLGVALLGPLLNAMVGCHCDGAMTGLLVPCLDAFWSKIFYWMPRQGVTFPCWKNKRNCLYYLGFLEFFLLSFPRCIGHMRPSSPAWARSQSKRCERCEYGKKRVLFKGQFRKVVFSCFSIAHIVYHCFILAFGFYMSTSHTWHLHMHYTKQSYGRCKGVNAPTAHHLA